MTMHRGTGPTSQGFALDSAAGWYDLLTLVPGERQLREMTIELAGIKRGDRVLDVGCGTGRLALLMKGVVGQEGHVAGIDLAPKMMTRAQRQAEKGPAEMDFRVASIAALPFPDDSFDVATSSLMARHLPRSVKEDGFAELCRKLTPGGRFLLCDFGPSAERWMWMIRPLVRLFAWAGEHPQDNLEWRIPAMLEEAGFATAETVAHLDLLAGVFRIYFANARAPVGRGGKELVRNRERRHI